MRYSIIIPHCHGAPESQLQRQEVDGIVQRLDRCELLTKFSGCPTVEHAVVAGLRAARGETIVVMEPGERYPATQVPALLRTLSRADFVSGRRRRSGWPKALERLGRFPRWLFLGLDARDPDCLFWAARREVFNGLPLAPRFVRYLPALVSRQGFRIDSIYVQERIGPAVSIAAAAAAAPEMPHVVPANLLSAWWACRNLRRAEGEVAVADRQAVKGGGSAIFRVSASDTSSEPYGRKSA